MSSTKPKVKKVKKVKLKAPAGLSERELLQWIITHFTKKKKKSKKASSKKKVKFVNSDDIPSVRTIYNKPEYDNRLRPIDQLYLQEAANERQSSEFKRLMDRKIDNEIKHEIKQPIIQEPIEEPNEPEIIQGNIIPKTPKAIKTPKAVKTPKSLRINTEFRSPLTPKKNRLPPATLPKNVKITHLDEEFEIPAPIADKLAEDYKKIQDKENKRNDIIRADVERLWFIRLQERNKAFSYNNMRSGLKGKIKGYPKEAELVELARKNNYGNILEEEKKIKEELYKNQGGSGKMHNFLESGLSTDQIQKTMQIYPDYIGTIPRDKIHELLPLVHPHSRVAFILNFDPAHKEGSHWISIYIDARPSGSNSIEYFDSYGRDIPNDIMKALYPIIKKISPDGYLKLKVNKIVQQSVNSNNCGFFSMQNLIDRFRGKPFKDITGYSEVAKNEKNIDNLKKKYPPFSILLDDSK